MQNADAAIQSRKALSELCILIMAAHWKAAGEWIDHAPIATELGVDRDALEALRKGQPARFKGADEIAVTALGREVHRRRRARLPAADVAQIDRLAEPAFGLAHEQNRLAGLPSQETGQRDGGPGLQNGVDVQHEQALGAGRIGKRFLLEWSVRDFNTAGLFGYLSTANVTWVGEGDLTRRDPPFGPAVSGAVTSHELTVRLLAFLARRTSNERVLLLVTVREEELPDVAMLRHTLEDLGRAGLLASLGLGPLTGDRFQPAPRI